MTKETVVINSLKNHSTKKLVELFNETEKQPITLELARVRGWIMEALEYKNPVAFDNWIDQCGTESLDKFFI